MAIMGKQDNRPAVHSGNQYSSNIFVPNQRYQIGSLVLSVGSSVVSFALPGLRSMYLLWERLRLDFGQACPFGVQEAGREIHAYRHVAGSDLLILSLLVAYSGFLSLFWLALNITLVRRISPNVHGID